MKFSLYYSLIYNLALFSFNNHSRIARRVKREYQKILEEKTVDPLVISVLNGKPFYCPFSHKLLFYQKEYPSYDRQLPKLCQWMRSQLGREINVVDVGANVGDTVRNIGIKQASYLCVEGDGKYSEFIKCNIKRYNYTLETVFLGESDAIASYSVEASNGTGHLVKSDNKEDVRLLTLDSLLKTNYPNKRIDLLKIDTDGFDFKVLRGSQKCLLEWHPLVFFEWDKAYCEEQGEDSLSVFPMLKDKGYSDCILFDNFGNLFDRIAICDMKRLEEIIIDTHKEGKPFYYDVLVVANNWADEIGQIYALFK